MTENGLSYEIMIENNWALKHKRKVATSLIDLLNEKVETSHPHVELRKTRYPAKRRVKDGNNPAESEDKIKGDDGYYYECVVCDLGGNLLCCDSCPRTYHLQCLNPPLKRTPPGKWECPCCNAEKVSEMHVKHTPESLSRKARSKTPIRRARTSGRVSASRKVAQSSKYFFPEKERVPSSSVGTLAFTHDILPTENNPVQGEGGLSTSQVSTQSSSSHDMVVTTISQKEIHISRKSLDSCPEAKIESPTRKLTIQLHHSAQREKKKKKIIAGHHEIKKPLTDDGKRVSSTWVPLEKSGALSTRLQTRHYRRGSLGNLHKSKWHHRVKKRVLLASKKSFKESSHPCTKLEKAAVEGDKSVMSEQSDLEGVKQVDRILGCRSQRTEVECYSGKGMLDVQGGENVNETMKEHTGKKRSKEDDIMALEAMNLCREHRDEGEITVEHTHAGAFAEEPCCWVSTCGYGESASYIAHRSQRSKKSGLHSGDELVKTETITAEQLKGAVGMSSERGQSGGTEKEAGILLENVMDHTGKEYLSYEFLVKWAGQSHIHNTWVSESQLKILAKRKLDNYKAKYGTASITLVQEHWLQPQRVIALRAADTGRGEALVKWSGLPYDECTWERVNEPAIDKFPLLISEFKRFETQAQRLNSEDVSSSVRKYQNVVPLAEQPAELMGGSLFPHQLEALNWLRKCWQMSKNVILADEMGLGKTVSACAFISSLYFEFKVKLPCLVLVPLSTMPNWVAEFASWAPHLNVVEYHGGIKARSIIRKYELHPGVYEGIQKGRHTSYKFNVLLTTYEMVLADSFSLRAVPWEVLVVDEGHRLKNSGSKLFNLLNTFSFGHRILLTGTPLQNNIGELYNLLNFLQAVSFPSHSTFEEKFNHLTTAEKVDELKKLVSPHMLRRLKKDAMKNIPPKTERIVPVELTSIQAKYYRAVLTKNYQILRYTGKGVAQQSMLNIVMQLRKVCNHPYLIPGTEPDLGSMEFLHEMRIKASAKLTLLHSMLKILKREGHRVLIFSQMTRLLDILEDYLIAEFGPRTFERVDGSVSVGDRQAAIARFNQDKTRFIFLLSTRSCGLGINLATADTVIIYDSDFNPHADIQAMNRAHRIGQSNRLLVYRLVVRASVEERILQLAKKKLMLDQLFVSKSGSQKEVEDILRWGTEELFCDSSDGDRKVAASTSPGSKSSACVDTEQKNKRSSGGLGDVYKDSCMVRSPKIVWDENAILKLLDRSNLESGCTENIEGDTDNDMLGFLKTLDWNEEHMEEQGNEQLSSDVVENINGYTSEKKDEDITNGAEENAWDRLLRVRWERFQIEEEASLGRGKRLRKAVSYKEAFTTHPNETMSGSENEEADLEQDYEPEYTPAGQALKEKYVKLRVRQKERLAKRHRFNPSCSLAFNLAGSEPTAQISTAADDKFRKEQPAEAVETQVSPDKAEDMLPHSSESPARNKHDPPLSQSLQIPRLNLLTCTLDSDILAHYFQSPRPGGNSVPCAATFRPGYAPDSSYYDSVSKDLQSYNEISRLSRRIGLNMRLPEYLPQPEPRVSNSVNVGSFPMKDLPATSRLHHHLNNITPEDFSNDLFPSTSQLKGPLEPVESVVPCLPSFQEKISASGTVLGDLQLKTPSSAGHVPGSGPGCFSNLSLNVESEIKKQPSDYNCAVPLFQNFLSPINHQAHVDPVPKLDASPMPHQYNSLPENHRKVMDNIFMKTNSGLNFKKQSKVEVPWSEDELDALWVGVRRHGHGNWESVLRDPRLKLLWRRTAEELSERWEVEQLKILEGPFQEPRTVKIPYPNLSDGMMMRAFLGSRFSYVNELEQFGLPNFCAHSADIKIGYGDFPYSILDHGPTDKFVKGNAQYSPIPLWKADKHKLDLTCGFPVGFLHRPRSSNAVSDAPCRPLAAPDNLQEAGASESLKFPHIPTDSHGDSQSSRLNSEFRSLNLSVTGKSPNSYPVAVSEEASGGCLSMDKLPHWLREAVVGSSKPPETHLPPCVSALTRSVRFLYGEDKPKIPLFTPLEPLSSEPEDRRKLLKKEKRQLWELQQLATENGASGSRTSLLTPSLIQTTSAWSEQSSLNLKTTQSCTIPTMRSSSGTLSPSPDGPTASSLSPSSQLQFSSAVPGETPALRRLEHVELGGKTMHDDFEDDFLGQKADGKMLDDWDKLTEEVTSRSALSGDSSKTHSDSCQVFPETGSSSEETVSDAYQREGES